MCAILNIIRLVIRFMLTTLNYISHSNVFSKVNSCLSDIELIELISRRESSGNTRLGADHYLLIMPSIRKDCSNSFLERSFIYAAAPCEWNKLS